MGLGSWLKKIGNIFRPALPIITLLFPRLNSAIDMVESITQSIKDKGVETFLTSEEKEDQALYAFIQSIDDDFLGDRLSDEQLQATRGAIRAIVTLKNAFAQETA
jgi:helix-turn-helix protein